MKGCPFQADSIRTISSSRVYSAACF